MASVLPFLSVAANPEGFASFRIGFVSGLVAFNITDSQQLVYVTGILAIVSLVVASASTILSQIMTARYVGDLGHWLRMQLIAKYYSQPYLYFVSRNSAVLTKKANADVYLFTAFFLVLYAILRRRLFITAVIVAGLLALEPVVTSIAGCLLCGILFYFHAASLGSGCDRSMKSPERQVRASVGSSSSSSPACGTSNCVDAGPFFLSKVGDLSSNGVKAR